MSRRPFKLAPSILSANFAQLEAELAQIDPSLADYIHVDIMDGHFVPNITFGPDMVKTLSSITSIPLDVHLMIEKPERYVGAFIKAGARIVTVHVEACPHLHRQLQAIKELGAKAGVSLNPATSLDTIKHVMDDLDLILIMSVNPGFGGQKFIPQALNKIKEARAMIGHRKIELEVDGGIKLENIKEVYDAGADVFVSGSGVFAHPPYNEILKKMRNKIEA